MNEMNITSAQYVAKEGENICIKAVIDDVTSIIPLDSANKEYAEILRQVATGTLTIQDAD
jgi:hypothetical protein|tara:strand:+ start:371 stop:550 length:180 start_codon:yes stop_codon:yes gene_type:complete